MNTRSPFHCSLVLSALGALVLVFQPALAIAAQEPVHIPLIVGLTTVRASETPQGDYESMRIVNVIDAKGFVVNTSGSVPADDGSEPVDISIARAVQAEDQRSARKIRIYFHSDDPQKFPGTVPGFSAVMVNELRSAGKSAVTYQHVESFFGMTVAREFNGTLSRVAGPATMPMLVNGQVVALPVLHAKGELANDDETETIEFDVLDDPANPIVLRFSGIGSTTKLIRIEYPQQRKQPDSIESKLARKEPAIVYGIYFDFAKADIRKESGRVLQEIAGILRDHADWKLRVDGHTDSIGNDAANLDLSQRRAAAVKAALVTRFKIDSSRLTTGGHGESAPQDTNETPEGRSRNRRVELRRE